MSGEKYRIISLVREAVFILGNLEAVQDVVCGRRVAARQNPE